MNTQTIKTSSYHGTEYKIKTDGDIFWATVTIYTYGGDVYTEWNSEQNFISIEEAVDGIKDEIDFNNDAQYDEAFGL